MVPVAQDQRVLELFLAMQGVDVNTMRWGYPDCMDAVYVVEHTNSSSLIREKCAGDCRRLVLFEMQFGEKRDSI